MSYPFHRFSVSALVVASTCALATALTATSGAAIVIRHDIADAAYLAKESDFPALFGIKRTKAGYKDCIATVVDRNWAVTAAHCVKDEKLLHAAGAAGKGYSVEIAGRAALIDKVVHHPGTGNGRAPDIALLRFASPVTHVAPVPLYRKRDEQGRIIVMPGWGQTGNGTEGLRPDDGLFRVAENVVDLAEAGAIRWKFDAPGPNSRALTLEGISGPGDSGGPALIKTPAGWAIAGISSRQKTMGGPEGVYGVEEEFVRVSDFAAWVDGHVQPGASVKADGD